VQVTQQVVCKTPQTTPAELKEAFEAGHDAFKTWKQTSLFSRQNILFK
jgi:malonate-semialdehyde dehydrogenase (acetylating)/methylmalonate-semialdehyde dehydrogenase